MRLFAKKKEEPPKPIYLSLNDEEYDMLLECKMKITSDNLLSGEEYWKAVRNILLSRGIVLNNTKQYDLCMNSMTHAIRLMEKPF